MSNFLMEHGLLLEQANLAVSFALVGLIWTIQLVHYPSFTYVADDCFRQFERFHARAISFIVMPLMIIELILAIVLSFLSMFNPLILTSLCIVLLIWGSTFLLSVPCHNKLAHGKDLAVIKRLVLTNWIRTILWSAKPAILFFA